MNAPDTAQALELVSQMIADHIGHRMAEKCEPLAERILAALRQLPAGEVERVAEMLWHRFANENELTWDEAHEPAVYRIAAADILATLYTAPPAQGVGWQPIESAPKSGTYLVASASGHVAPWINGVIHNNVGTAHDWQFGEAATHWQPLPPPPASGADNG